MSEVNLEALKEITFSALKEQRLDKSLENNKDHGVKQYKALEASCNVLREDVESSLKFISMLNQLAIIAENLAEAKKKDLDKNKQEEYKEKFEKVQKAILNEIDVPDEFVQLIQVAATGGVEALEQVASWARKTAKEMRNSDELNAKIDKLQSQQTKLENIGKAVFRDASAREENFDRYSLAKKAFQTNSSEEEYRMQLTRLERSRKQERI